MNDTTGKNFIATDYEHAGSIAGCVHLNAHDIGRAKAGRKVIWFAWGDMMYEREAKARREEGLDTVRLNGSWATVLPFELMLKLSTVIVWDKAVFKKGFERQIKLEQEGISQEK